ncbi:aminotransferase class III-fold pyridoxal phosphate-dependent enzyme [Shewanella abyssi]|uniref:aminotransferase class III-fold pyridoxal phosphate-dependent enzyme n=1 Tax=Shewanella abyssi TaxID=311789 RepID=UPI00200F3DAC|nr:aminotransferase class III-fold pyridoxal phosphate-dependent enzyme [Shewanella abyssi]MCL1049661.1 aminotransferase class III-fold pyridoxal phosphate-dependent enzyme [Shewanella abyssi]
MAMEALQTKVVEYSPNSVKMLAQKHFKIAVEVKALPGYDDLNFLLSDSAGKRFILKIANADASLAELDMQNSAMNYLDQQHFQPYQLPKVIKNQSGYEITALQDKHGRPRQMRLLSYVAGTFYSEHKRLNTTHHQQLGVLLAKLDLSLQGFSHRAASRHFDWDLKHAESVIRAKVDLISEQSRRKQVLTILSLFEQQVSPFKAELPQGVIHNDVNDYNLLLSSADEDAEVVGLIDFGDMVHSYQINELAIACAYAILATDTPLEIIKTITLAYHQHRPLNGAEIWVLLPLIAARLAVSVCNSAEAILAEPDNDYLMVSAKPAWAAIATLLKLDAKSASFELQRLCFSSNSPSPITADNTQFERHQHILNQREQRLFKTLSVSYQQPLIIERGQGQFLLDENNIAYLDMVNNVCHVGHCHPAVVAAGQTQMAKLNTNTRYLNDNILQYSQALLKTFPERLSVVMFVNSGSEANELAMRLMRCKTQSDELLVVDGAYHGNTNKAIEISPYKFNGPGGEGAAAHIHVVPMPDPYRGEHKGMSITTGQAYALPVEQAIVQLQQRGKTLGGYICESLQGVGGNLIMPNGYLKAVYSAVRKAGGVCIADEVQVGFGRVGTHWWAFETQDVVPDIVTLGKPIGNGHPMAAVVTTKEIADAFVTGMEYFNTFGGNPVSCAIGKAVLDAIDDENMMQNAQHTGDYMQASLQLLKQQFDIIGDIRGLGLFIGVELVEDEQLTPATEKAKTLVEWFKSRHILLSLDGPFSNVLKIKPPMVFNHSNVDYFIEQLTQGLSQISK